MFPPPTTIYQNQEDDSPQDSAKPEHTERYLSMQCSFGCGGLFEGTGPNAPQQAGAGFYAHNWKEHGGLARPVLVTDEMRRVEGTSGISPEFGV